METLTTVIDQIGDKNMKKQDVFFIIALICLVPLIAFLLFSLDSLAIFCSILIFVLTVLGVIAMYLDDKSQPPTS